MKLQISVTSNDWHITDFFLVGKIVACYKTFSNITLIQTAQSLTHGSFVTRHSCVKHDRHAEF